MSRRAPLGIDDSDPWADPRRIRDQTLRKLPGDDAANYYERGVIAMVWQDLTGEEVWP